MITMTINGVNPDTALGSGSFRVTNIQGRGPARREANLLEVPGRNGAYLRRVKTPPRTLDIGIVLKASSLTNLRTLVDELNELIVTEGTVPITFSDEGKTYYGVLADTTDWEEIRTFGIGVLQFVCPDPYKYDAEQFVDVDPLTDSATFVIGGNEETKPRFEATATASVTHVDFVRGDGEYMRIGRPADMTDTQYERETLVLHDTMDTTTGWTAATYVDNGYITGQMSATGGAFYASLWGTAVEPYGWQGPSLKRSIGQALDQFKVEVLLENLNVGGNIGMIEIYLLDADNNTVAKIGIEDTSQSSDLIRAKMQVGPNDSTRVNYSRYADSPSAWNDFDGVIRLTRTLVDGAYKYTPYFAKIDAQGNHHVRSGLYSYYDYGNAHDAQITQVQVAIRVFPGTTNDYSEMRVHDIKVWSINEQPAGIPMILHAGDTLVIDHTTEDILINGEPRKDLKDFGATYFSFKPGTNTVYQYPHGALDTTVYWRNKYK